VNSNGFLEVHTSRTTEPQYSSRFWLRPSWQLILVVFGLNVVSAMLFIHFVNRPIYDDQFNIVDVHMFASQGLTLDTIRAIKTPPGPTGFAWLALGVRFFGGEELRDARIGALLTWALIVAGVLLGAPHSRSPELWYGALLTSLVFPHSVEAAALVLTEGPALLFAVLGALAWVELSSRPRVTPSVFAFGILGAFAMGLAVTSRQYFLALLPAAMLLAIRQSRIRNPTKNTSWRFWIILSLAVAAAPVIVLVIIWHGFSSPGMAMGTSYPGWQAGVGLSLFRPLIAAFYTAFYLVPLTLPAALRAKTPYRWQIIVSALLGGVLVARFGRSMLQPGPLRTVVHAIGRGSAVESIILGFIGALTIYNAATVARLLWERRTALLSCPPFLFGLLMVMFFVAEQCGVGGNIPFYDRYLLQVAPFLGLIAFALTPRLTYPSLLFLATMSGVSHEMLWRFALGAPSLS
jgi:hypothetical protein